MLLKVKKKASTVSIPEKIPFLLETRRSMDVGREIVEKNPRFAL